MKTNMKNKKTMLAAILVVAAFAAFSAAAVFEDSQSDAATITPGSIVEGTYYINVGAADGDVAFNIGAEEATIIIAEGASFSGKLYFGISEGDGSLDTKAVISLDKVGGKTGSVTLFCDVFADPTPTVVIINGDTAGTVRVTEGALQLGGEVGGVEKEFNGTASGNTVTIKSQNTAGLVIKATADKKTDRIYGEAVKPVGIDPDVVYAIDLDGKAEFISNGDGDLDVYKVSIPNVDLEVNVNGTLDIIYDAGAKKFDVSNKTTVNVNGALNIDVTKLTGDQKNALQYGAIGTGNVTVNIDGTLKVIGADFDVIKTERIFRLANVNAAYYSTEVKKSGEDSTYTHTYTTLENAMSKSADIFVTGNHYIAEDTTLTGNSSFEEEGEMNNITLVEDAEVYVGFDGKQTDKKDNLFQIEVTVPATTTLTADTNAKIIIKAGKLVVNQKEPVTEEDDISYSDEVAADVFMVVDKAGVFTDLATALDISKSGDEVVIRESTEDPYVVTLAFNATLKEGVKLNAGNADYIAVAEDVTFIVNGEVLNLESLTVEGTVVLNSADFDNTATEITVDEDGTLTFGQVYDNTGDGDTVLVIADESEGVINVNGKVNLEAAGDISGKVNVYGTLVLTLGAGKSVAELFVADTGDVKASDEMDVTVKEFTAGTAPENLEQYVNNAKAMVNIDNGGTYTVYGKAANVKFVKWEDGPPGKYVSQTGLESTAYYFEKGAVLYATVGVNNADPAIEIYALETPDVNGQEFQAWYATSSKVFMVELDAKIGDYAKVYADFDAATITVTLENVQNATWFINDVRYDSGAAVVVWAQEYTVKLVADNGFKADGKVLVNDAAFAGALADGDRLTFDGSVNASSPGTDMQTILLAVIAVAAIVIAVVFVVRLMRS